MMSRQGTPSIAAVSDPTEVEEESNHHEIDWIYSHEHITERTRNIKDKRKKREEPVKQKSERR